MQLIGLDWNGVEWNGAEGKGIEGSEVEYSMKLQYGKVHAELLICIYL